MQTKENYYEIYRKPWFVPYYCSSDSFFTASGKKPFAHRLIVITTDNVSPHVDAAMQGQHTPTQKITLSDLENSKRDWGKTFQQKAVQLKESKELRPYQ